MKHVLIIRFCVCLYAMHFNHILKMFTFISVSMLSLGRPFSIFPVLFLFLRLLTECSCCIVVYNKYTQWHYNTKYLYELGRHLCHFPLDLTLLKSTSIWKWRWNSIGTFSLYYNMFVSHGTLRIKYVHTHIHIHILHISWPKTMKIESQKNHSTRNFSQTDKNGVIENKRKQQKKWDIERVQEIINKWFPFFVCFLLISLVNLIVLLMM